MRIILSPTKKMKIDNDSLVHQGLPVFLEQTEEILQWLKEKSTTELKVIWNCNDKIIEQNRQRLLHMKLRENLTPAVLAYEGIAFQYMAPGVFENEQFDYIQEHLRILSAFYGVLKPMDGVTPYRLEMQAKASIGSAKNLYDYWGTTLNKAGIEELIQIKEKEDEGERKRKEILKQQEEERNKKIQELKAKVGPKIQALITDINSYYPADIVKYYSPDYAADLLNKIGGDVKA